MTELRAIDDRLASVERQVTSLRECVAELRAQEEGHQVAMKLFWDQHWPQLLHQIGQGTAALQRLEQRFVDLDTRVDRLTLDLWRLIAAMVGSGVLGGTASQIAGAIAGAM